jgi:hypothetical protein
MAEYTLPPFGCFDYAPDEKDYKTVLAFLAEERIKFSSILVGISVPSSTQCQCSFYFFIVWESHTKLALRRKHNILMVNTPFNITNLQCIPVFREMFFLQELGGVCFNNLVSLRVISYESCINAFI